VNYINTPFDDMFHNERVTHGMFGIDDGVITVDRGRDLLSWQSIGELPEGEIKGPTCGLHWPNLLHPDPKRNGEIVQSWRDFLKPYNEKAGTLLARNSEVFCHQLVHHRCTTLKVTNKHIKFDFSDTDKLGSTLGQNDFVLKIESQVELVFEPDNILLVSDSVNKMEDNFLYTLKMSRIPDRKEAKLIYKSKI
jgi:hypothetical protein